MVDKFFERQFLKHPAPWRLTPQGTQRHRVDDARGLAIWEVSAESHEVAVLLVSAVNRLAELGPFCAEAADAGRAASRMASVEQLRVRLAQEFDELRREVSRPCGERNWAILRTALLAIAATSLRAAWDFDLQTQREAIEKDIPF